MLKNSAIHLHSLFNEQQGCFRTLWSNSNPKYDTSCFLWLEIGSKLFENDSWWWCASPKFLRVVHSLYTVEILVRPKEEFICAILHLNQHVFPTAKPFNFGGVLSYLNIVCFLTLDRFSESSLSIYPKYTVFLSHSSLALRGFRFPLFLDSFNKLPDIYWMFSWENAFSNTVCCSWKFFPVLITVFFFYKY